MYIFPHSGYREAVMRITTALILLLISAQTWAANKVEDARLSTEADTSRLVLNLSESPSYKVFTLANPARVVIDLSDARLAASLPNNFNGSPVQSVRSGIRNGRDLRVVVDLGAKVSLKSFVLQPSDNQGYRLVIDLIQPGVVSAAGAPTPQPAPVIAVAPQPAPVSVAKSAPTAAANPPEADLRDIIVAIDAGHGSEQPVVVSASWTGSSG